MSIHNLINKGIFFTDLNFKTMDIKENLDSLANFEQHLTFSYIYFHNIYYCIADLFEKRQDIYSITFEGQQIHKDDDILMDCLIILRDENSNIIDYPQFKKEFDNIINSGKEKHIYVNNHQENLLKMKTKELISFFDFEIDRESSSEIFEHIFKYINPKIYSKFGPFENFGKHTCPVYYNIFEHNIKIDIVKCQKEDLQLILDDVQKFHKQCSDAVLAYQVIPFLLKNPEYLNDNEAIIIINLEEDNDNYDDDQEVKYSKAALYGIKKNDDLSYNKENIILELYSPYGIADAYYLLRDYRNNKHLYSYQDNILQTDKIKKILESKINTKQLEKFIAYYTCDIDKTAIMANIDMGTSSSVINKKRL